MAVKGWITKTKRAYTQ